MVAHPDRRRVTVDVTQEALGPAVGDAHGTTEPQGEQTRVHLQADVLPSTERATDTAQRQTHRLLGQPETGGDLRAVLVQPLGRDVQLDAAATAVGDRQCRLEAEERLVLHPDLVGALDHDVTGRVGSPCDDPLVTDDVAVGMDRRVTAGDRGLGIEQRLEEFVLDDDRSEGTPAGLGMIAGDGGDRLADVADDVGREHGLILAISP